MHAPLAAAVFFLLAATPAQADENCLACHGQKDVQAMATKPGRNLFVDPARYRAGLHAGVGCTSCHTTIKEYPHPQRVPRVSCAACHAEPPGDVSKSVHAARGAQACASCHGDAHEVQRAAQLTPQQCSSCHAQIVQEYQSGVHALARRHGTPDTPTCQSCHGPTHKIQSVHNPASLVAKRNLPDTCGSCHANPDFLARHRIPFARPVEAYRLSVHGHAIERGNEAAPSCSDCHASHAIFAARDSRSRINHWNVTKTCGTCHTEIKKTYDESVHGTAVALGVRASPVCTDCHGEHTILAPSEPGSLVNPARVSSVTCGRCHEDERIAQRYNLPRDKVPAFADSYHGLALRSGAQTFANCASCHGVHNILPSSDPRSMVHPANLASTCGACHPGAGQRFSIGPVHVRPATTTEHVVVKWIRVGYWLIIPLTLAFMFLHNLIDFIAKFRAGAAFHRSGETVLRMNLNFRIAHWLVVISFPTLVITGFALKFPESWWAQPILLWESSLGLRGIIHRVAAVIMMASMVYHAIHLIVVRRDRAFLRHMIPNIKDLTDMIGVLRYNLGLSKERPMFAKFNYAEKVEYLAFIWGSLIMTVSGFLLWFNNFTLRNFPKWVTDAATAIHYYEAILATFSILLWHFYLTIFDPDVYPMDCSWITGKASADHLRHTRPAYYYELVRQQRAANAAASEASADKQGSEEAPQDPTSPPRGPVH